MSPGSALKSGKTAGINVWRTNFTPFTQLLELFYTVKLSAVMIAGFVLVISRLTHSYLLSAKLQSLLNSTDSEANTSGLSKSAGYPAKTFHCCLSGRLISKCSQS